MTDLHAGIFVKDAVDGEFGGDGLSRASGSADQRVVIGMIETVEYLIGE